MPESSNNPIRLLAVGDIALNDAYGDLIEVSGPGYPFERLSSRLSSADVLIGNLEGPLTERESVFPGKCSLRSRPEYVEGLVAGGFSAVSLANNHILDSGDKGLRDTLDNLEHHGVKHAGIVDGPAGQTPAIIEVKGKRIGLLAYCDVTIDSPFYFPDVSPGVARFELESTVSEVSRLSDRVDTTVVSLHWGIENLSYPSPAQVQAAHALVDAGAQLVLGHHPHVVQGIERYRKGCIAYCLGNWVFGDVHWETITERGKALQTKVKLRRSNRRSIILDCALGKDGIESVDIIPCRIAGDLRVVGDPSMRRIRAVKRLSARLSRGNYSAQWKGVLRKHRLKESAREKLAPSRLLRIHRLRPRHIRDLYNTLVSAVTDGEHLSR